jgi:predicted AAA+ superfamily ATPase
MIKRNLTERLNLALNEVPAVGLLGARQVGKTTLAMAVGEERGALYLDLESDADRVRLAEPEEYLARNLDRLVILDEVHRVPGLFPVLRGIIDRARRDGKRHGLFLLLGSASPDLLRQSGESLAGRIRYLDLGPLSVLETEDFPQELLWLRGGFPDSLLAENEAQSLRWRQDFIRSYLEREIPQFGFRLAAETLRRFWTMLAHRQGAPLNVAELARGLGIDVRTTNRYLDLLVDLFMLRRLQPWHANVGKRLVKTPKIYLRDSGVLHALLSIGTVDTLLSHPVLGMSWEGFVIESLLSAIPHGTEPYFFRSSGGAEIDLLLDLPGGERWAIEIKRSLTPQPGKGFHAACADTNPSRKFLVYPGTARFPLQDGIEALSLIELARALQTDA